MSPARKISTKESRKIISKVTNQMSLCEFFGIESCAVFGINENLSINAESGASAARAVFLRYPAMNARSRDPANPSGSNSAFRQTRSGLSGATAQAASQAQIVHD